MKWIQKSIKHRGALHRSLGIAPKEKIPSTLLDRIISAKAGQKIHNPTHTGKRVITVTRKLEERAILARNLRRMR